MTQIVQTDGWREQHFLANRDTVPYTFPVKTPIRIIQLASLALALSSFTATMFFFSRLVSGVGVATKYEIRSQHFLLFVPTYRSNFYSQLEKGARTRAEQLNASISVYTLDNRGIALSAAIAMKPDGVIVCPGGDDPKMVATLVGIRSAGIPVVLANHSIKSDLPWTWVGANAYEYGKKLGSRFPPDNQNRKKIAIVYSEKNPSLMADQDLLEMGIFSVHHPSALKIIPLETGRNPRDAERAVWEHLKKHPDTDWFVFTDAGDTLAGAQAIIDLNLVGKIRISGFGIQGELSPYIEKGIIESCLYIDPLAIGAGAVSSLAELQETGFTSSTVDIGVQLFERSLATIPERLP